MKPRREGGEKVKRMRKRSRENVIKMVKQRRGEEETEGMKELEMDR